MDIREINPQSPEYSTAVNLRERVLRKPLGFDFTESEMAEDASDTHFIMTDGDEIAGTVVLKKESPELMRLRQLAVEPKYQGRNIGGFLISHCEAFAQKSGAKKIKMHARNSVVKFYEKYGYVVVSDQFTEVGLPHFEMEKSL